MGQVAGVAGDDGCLMADRGGDHDRVHDIGGARGCAGHASGPADAFVVRDDVAAFEHPGDLMLGPAAPDLSQHDHRHDRADARGGQLVMQGKEIRVAAFGSQQRAGVVNDGGNACHRRLSTGEVVDPAWLRFSFPTWWHYDVLRALDYFRAAGDPPDPRLAEAITLLRSKQHPDGTWLLEDTHPGAVHFSMEDGDGHPSRWNTLRALRVLHWYDGTVR
jgi:hypothetical protein